MLIAFFHWSRRYRRPRWLKSRASSMNRPRRPGLRNGVGEPPALCDLAPQAVDVVDADKQPYEFLTAGHDTELGSLFDRIDHVAIAVGRPNHLALEACACNHAEEKSGGAERDFDLSFDRRPQPWLCSLERREATKPCRMAAGVSVQIRLDRAAEQAHLRSRQEGHRHRFDLTKSAQIPERLMMRFDGPRPTRSRCSVKYPKRR
jgi:hypothetical protein